MSLSRVDSFLRQPKVLPDPDTRPQGSGTPRRITTKPHVKFYGGKLLTKPSIASIYVGNFWQSAKGKREADFQNGFAKQLVKGSFTSIWSQYGVGKGTFSGADTLALATTPAVVNDALAQRIVRAEIQSGKLPKANDQTIYTLYLPPGTVLKAPGGETSLEGVGGYHSSFDLAPGKRVYYAVLAYSQGNNGIDFTGSPKDNVTITASHEWTEAATDPDVNHGRLGWYDKNLGEISDIPLSIGLPLKEVYQKLDGYYVQKQWSEKDHALEVEAAD